MLTRRQVSEFYDRGYVTVPGVFSRAELGRMRRGFDRLARVATRLGRSTNHRGSRFVLGRRPSGAIRIDRIVWCGAAEPALEELGRAPRLLEMASCLLDTGAMNQLINQAHFKLPGDEVAFPWHQDSVHRRYGRGEWRDANGKGSYVQTVVAVDDMTAENGPIEFLPGSCRLGHQEPDPGRPGELPVAVARAARETVTVAAGGVLLFGPYTFHRSLPNRSRLPRRAFINGFAYPGANTRVYPGRGAGRLIRVR